MDRRTFEGPMEWEYQDTTGPVDVTSPFAQVARSNAQNPFASPARFPSTRPNPFAGAGSPSRSQPHPPQSSLFSPKIQPGQTAAPFRNPAFTTPRKPFDESVFSEASGAESSPAFTDTSAAPNDTPELDRLGELNMGTITPSRVDKTNRYAKASSQARRYMAGRGEIRSHRDLPMADSIRKRKRHNQDRDVGSVRLHQQHDWDDSEEERGPSDGVLAMPRSPRKISGRMAAEQTQAGWLRNLFSVMDDHPNAPDNIYNWVRLALNVVIVGAFVFLGYSVYDTVRSDVTNANEAARAELTAKMMHCLNEYTINQCAKKDRPALKTACDEWYECSNQDPAAVMRVRVTAKQIAEVINEFSGAMHLKAWAFFFGVIFLCIIANNLSWARSAGGSRPPPPMPSHPTTAVPPDMGPTGFNPDYSWMHTPHRRRLANFIDDGTDTDGASPPEVKTIMFTPAEPKQGRPVRSPAKLLRSPSKGYH